MSNTRETLKRIAETCAQTFQGESRVRSFREYLDEFLAQPGRLGRSAARYVTDCFDYHGTEVVQRIGGPVTRWKLFDAPFDEGKDHLVGQEDIQREFYQALASFSRSGRVDRLVLLHGPNGSAKTTFCELVFRALEAYSALPEGILYRNAWVFPTREAQGKRLGFGDERSESAPREETYAYLGQDEIGAKLACELKDPPLLLLPASVRRELLDEAFPDPQERVAHRWLYEGEPCAKCKKVFDGLYRLHRGNLLEVLRHVQVERYFISQRYRIGAVRIQPQSHVDASEFQVSADRSISALPPALQDMNLFVPAGDLIDGNGGMIEFSDFLKRPLEMNKYLLTTCEKGTISLPTSIAHLNTVLVATTNELQLDELKKQPLFTSFNARLDLITAPYLLQPSLEARIYDDVLASLGARKHVAPHVAEVAATWAVLCRLHRPDPDNHDPELRPLLRELAPLEKARLYDGGVTPRRLPAEARAMLRAAIPALRDESRESIHYEGRYGPSAREMRAALMDCRYDSESPCISPTSLFRQIRRLVKDKSLHEFLRIEPDNGYHHAEALLEVTQGAYIDTVEEELRQSMQLVQVDQWRRIFERYIQHVNALRGRERVRNAVTGKMEDPDQQFIRETEAVIAGGTRVEQFRESLIGKVGAWRIDHPAETPDYSALFPEALQALQEDYYQKNARGIDDVRQNLARYGTEDLQDLEPDLRRRVVDAMEALVRDHGYCPSCAKEAVAFAARD